MQAASKADRHVYRCVGNQVARRRAFEKARFRPQYVWRRAWQSSVPDRASSLVREEISSRQCSQMRRRAGRYR
eukprot:3160896-Pleurochrysis_carterae.AAC.1